jgi:YVTN family beta-propeller protein
VGKFPSAIGITPNGAKVYVPNQDSNTVSVIDAASHTVIATIPVGNSPIGIAITPDGKEAYVTNSADNSVSVISTVTNTVVATIPVGSNPIPIAITPNGQKAYVANNFPDNTVSVIDTASHMVETTFPVGSEPFAIAITPDGAKVFVINLFGQSVSIIRTSDNTVISSPVFDVPVGVAIMPDGTHAYVTDQNNQSVSVINVAANNIDTTISLLPNGDTPHGIAITPDGKKAFTANQFSTVSIISTATNTVQTTISTPGNSPTSIAITPDGSKAYVASTGNNNVWVIDTTTNMLEVITTVESDPAVISIAADQAPLAKFSIDIAPAGFSTTFDASASISPVGTIEKYFWDFGDGHTLNASHPISSHTYAVPGNYIVSLIVTNSAGTSTTQVFNPAAATVLTGFFECALKLFSNATTIINNGGPSAKLTQMFTVLPPPPKHLKGRQIIKNRCRRPCNIINILTWKASSKTSPPVAFRIYRDKDLTKLAATIENQGQLHFVDPHRKWGKTYTYYIVSEDKFGEFSESSKIVIKGRCLL